MSLRLAVVWWKDPYDSSEHAWEPLSDHIDSPFYKLCLSTGFVLIDTDEGLKLCANRGTDDDEVGNVLNIPRCVIEKVEYLEVPE